MRGRRGGSQDRGRAQRFSALVAAYHSGVAAAPRLVAVAFGWVRAGGGRACAGRRRGDALVGSPPTGEECCSRCPAGRGGRRSRQASSPAGSAGLGLAGGRRDQRRAARRRRDRRTAAGRRAWRFARRRAARELERAVRLARHRRAAGPAELRRWQRRRGAAAARRRGGGPVSRAGGGGAAAEGAARRAARGASAGFWRITSRLAGADAASAARVAGLFCASADLDGLPYALSPVAPAACPGSRTGPAGTGPVGAVLRVHRAARRARPAAGGEVPGVRLALRPDFDVTPGDSPWAPGQRKRTAASSSARCSTGT